MITVQEEERVVCAQPEASLPPWNLCVSRSRGGVPQVQAPSSATFFSGVCRRVTCLSRDHVTCPPRPRA
eukprot:286154-Rhodomonas_salina.3